MWHNPKVVKDSARFGGKVNKWDAADAFRHVAEHPAAEPLHQPSG